MKKIMISVAILIASKSFSQMTETKKIATGTGKWKIDMEIKDSKDTMTYFYYSYQNSAYKQIVDIGSIYLEKKKELIDIANAFKALSKKESGAQIQVKILDYELRLYDFSDDIYIVDENNKYTHISKEDASLMADEFIANAKFLRK
jgi:hypothetical protein